MKRLEGMEDYAPPTGGSVVSIGNFDGVHRGHQCIVAQARTLAQDHAADVVVITFEPHPVRILRPERGVDRLTAPNEKQALLERAGVDACLTLQTTPALLSLEAPVFLQQVIERCRPKAFVEGPDFNFGRERRGSIQTLRAHAPDHGYSVHEVPAAVAEHLPGMPRVSSSAVRAAILSGHVDYALEMLGRPHRLTGTVVLGDERGGKLGIPTANLAKVPQVAPGEGVYACTAQLTDGRCFAAAVNVGRQPTFDQYEPRIEAHLLDFEGALRGDRLGLWFLRRLRDVRKFSSPTELVEQIRKDMLETRQSQELMPDSLRTTTLDIE